MTKARDLANASTALSAVSATELAFVDGVTSAIQTQMDAKTAKATLTTTGDIYYASAANTPARLGIGTTGQVLNVASGVPAWATASAGGMTLLSTTTLSGVSTTVSSISQSYKNLYIEWQGVTSDTDSVYDIQLNAVNGGHFSNATYSAAVAWTAYRDNVIKLTNNQDTQGSSANNAGSVTVFNYASTTARKPFSFQSIFVRASTAVEGAQGAGGYNSTTAISSLKFNNPTGATFTAGTLRIYGVN